jgi:CheY-like chemotaxis protein
VEPGSDIGPSIHVWQTNASTDDNGIQVGYAIDRSLLMETRSADKQGVVDGKRDIMTSTVRVLIADDRARSRNGLRALLSTYLGIEVVGEAGDGRAALRLVETCKPDVVVMDVRMPGVDGLTATREIKTHWPKVRVVMLTLYEALQNEAVASGADAFLVKGCPAEKLLAAIRNGTKGVR